MGPTQRPQLGQCGPTAAQVVDEHALQLERQNVSAKSKIVKAAKWAKDHIVGGLKWIGLKFRF